MTNEEYAERVKGPGKFQGESAHVAWFWEEWILHGFADDHCYDSTTEISAVFVTDECVEVWPVLAGVAVIALWESETGFVYHRTFATRGAWEAWRDEAEDTNEEG